MTGIAALEGKQLQAFHPPAACEVIIFEGAVRSSKTIVSLLYWCKFVRAAPAGNLLMVGNTIDTLIRNVLQPLQDMLGTKRVRWNRSTGEAEILGRRVYIMGAHDESARKRVQGLTLIGAYVDEVAGVPESFFDMLRTRLSTLGAVLIATCNPEGPKHWLLVKWLARARWWVRDDGSMVEHAQGDLVKVGDEQLPVIDLYRVTFILDDNAWLVRTNPRFVASLKSSMTGVFYQRNILSRWVSAEGMVYPEFTEARHVIEPSQLPTIESVLMVALDYGQNHPTRAYALGLGRAWFNVRTNEPIWNRTTADTEPAELRYCLFVLSEFAPGSGTVGSHAAEFVTWLKSIASFGAPQWIAIDPAALVFKTELFSLGYSNVMGAHNAVVPGIQLVQSLFAAGRMFVVNTATKLIGALPGYVWSIKATEAGRTEPLKENDDEADALRYAVYTSRRDWRELIPLAPLETADTEEAD